MIVACCNGCPYREYCGVPSHGSLSIVATHESGGGCLPLLAARTRRRRCCRTPFDSIPRLPLSRLQHARLPMRSHAPALLASALIRLFALLAPLFALPLPLFALPLRLFALPVPLFALSAPVSGTQHSTPFGAYTWLLPKQSRCRCGSGGARSRCRCGGPSPGADVAGVEWAALRRAPARSVIDQAVPRLGLVRAPGTQNNTPQRCAEPSRGFCRAIGAPSTELCHGAGGRAGRSPRVAPSQLAKTALLPRATWHGQAAAGRADRSGYTP